MAIRRSRSVSNGVHGAAEHTRGIGREGLERRPDHLYPTGGLKVDVTTATGLCAGPVGDPGIHDVATGRIRVRTASNRYARAATLSSTNARIQPAR